MRVTSRWLPGIVALALAGAPSCKGRGEAPPAAQGPRFPAERIAVIGASVSAGFASPKLASLLAEQLPDSAVGDFADLQMFRAPRRSGAEQIEQARAFEPSAVFAVDFLFWYVYGSGMELEERRAALAGGLTALDRLDAPVVVGDLPDVRGAAEWMIAPSAVPSAGELDALNRELRAWAAAREQVIVVPLAAWVAQLRAGGEIAVPGHPPADARELLSFDGVHATAKGMAYLLTQIGAVIRERYPGTPPELLDFVR